MFLIYSLNIFSVQCKFDMGLYDVLSNLSLPCFNMGRILDIFNINGKIPAMSDLLIANVIWGAKAVGLILRNFILVSLKPLDDELLDFLMMFKTLLTVMGGILKTPFGVGMRLCRKISGLKNIALNPTLIFCILTFQNRFKIQAIFVRPG